jgi:hypothetical protein
MREERERLQEAGRGSVEPTTCHPYAGDGERRPRDGRMLPLSGVARMRGRRQRQARTRAGLAWSAGPETRRRPVKPEKFVFFYK